MIGNRVRVYRSNGGTFEGNLVRQDSAGVTVHRQQGLDDTKLFIPYSQMTHMQDCGRSYI